MNHPADHPSPFSVATYGQIQGKRQRDQARQQQGSD